MDKQLLEWLAYAAIAVAIGGTLMAVWRTVTGRDDVGQLVGIVVIALVLAVALGTAADLRWAWGP